MKTKDSSRSAVFSLTWFNFNERMEILGSNDQSELNLDSNIENQTHRIIKLRFTYWTNHQYIGDTDMDRCCWNRSWLQHSERKLKCRHLFFTYFFRSTKQQWLISQINFYSKCLLIGLVDGNSVALVIICLQTYVVVA